METCFYLGKKKRKILSSEDKFLVSYLLQNNVSLMSKWVFDANL